MNPKLSFFAIQRKSPYLFGLIFLTLMLWTLLLPGTAQATSGGPDSGDYIFIDSLSGCNTTFTDISSTGTALNLFDDDEAFVPMPFVFEFYDTDFSSILIGNNGGIVFSLDGFGNISAGNAQLPTFDVSGPAILPYWDDIDGGAGNVYYETVGLAPNRRFIVQWHERGHYSFGGAVTFQAILYENLNTIDFVYEDVLFGSSEVDAGASATIGIQESASGPGFLQYSYNDNTLLSSGATAICFSKGVLNKSVNVDEALPGDPITYTLTLQNNLNETLTDIIITDTFPTSVTVTSITSSGFFITETQPYVWMVSDVMSGSSGMITITGIISDDPALLGTTIINSASITGNGLRVKTPATAEVYIPAPDLSTSYKNAPLYLTSDSTINYLIALENSSISIAENTILTDPIPVDTTYIPGSVTGGATYNSAQDQIEWIGDIAPASAITISYAVSVTVIPAIITNTATIVQTFLSTPLLLTTRTQAVVSIAPTNNFCVDFEDGQLPTFMLTETTESGTATGRAEVSQLFAHGGDYALQLDTMGGSIYSAGFTTQAAIMLLDMSDVSAADLSFWLYYHDDEYHPTQDGLFISDDGGATYTQVLNFHNYTRYNYTEVSVDLADFVASQGMTLTQNFLLKFQSYDNTSLLEDGFVIDDICLTTAYPEIEVAGNDMPIADNSVIPNTADNTEFGALPIVSGRAEHTFTIHNTGTGNLLLDEVTITGPHAGNFEIVQQPSILDLASGLTTDFRVAFSTSVAALRQAVINIFSNDEDESHYDFNIQGRGVAVPVVNDGFTIRIPSLAYTATTNFIFEYDEIFIDVEGIGLDNLAEARFEIRYDPEIFDAYNCNNDGLILNLVTCDINQAAGSIEVHVNANGAVGGDVLFTRLVLAPRSEGISSELEIVPISALNSDGEPVEPTIENGEITLIPEFEATPVPPTETPTPEVSTPTPCPVATQEFFAVDPIDSPVHVLTQTVTIYISNGEEVTISGESGIFTATGDFDGSANPAMVEITLLPDQVNTFTIEARVREISSGDCTYGGYTLGQTLRIEHHTPTPEPTDEPTPTEMPTATSTEMPTETSTGTPTETPTATPTMTSTMEPTSTDTPTATPCPEATREFLSVEFTSPTIELTQLITVYIGNGEHVAIIGASGTFTATGDFNSTTNPAEIEITLLENRINVFDVEATVRETERNGCIYGGYTLLEEIEISQQIPTSTNTPTMTPTSTSTSTATATSTSTATDTPTNIPTATATMHPPEIPTEPSTEIPTEMPTVTNTSLPTETSTPTPTLTLTFTPTSTETPTSTPTRTPRPAQLAGDIQPSQTVLQPGDQVRYGFSIENQGETVAEDVKVEVTLPSEFQLVENQPLEWMLKEGTEDTYELPLGSLSPNSTTQTFVLLVLDSDVTEETIVQTPGMAILADGNIEPFRIVMGAGANIIIEMGEEQTPTDLVLEEEPERRVFLPIIQR